MKPDMNVESVRIKLLQRSQMGIVKYQISTERKDFTGDDWLQHLQEELMDACVYIEAFLNRGKWP